jgi:hypothetical protein
MQVSLNFTIQQVTIMQVSLNLKSVVGRRWFYCNQNQDLHDLTTTNNDICIFSEIGISSYVSVF